MEDKLTGPKLFELIMSKMEDTDIQRKVIEVLERFDGKKPSKWMATAIEKEMPGYSVDFSSDRKGWSPSTISVGRNRFNVGYRNSAFDHDAFKAKYLTEVEEAEKRNEARNQFIMDNKCAALVEALDDFNERALKLSEMLEECPVKSLVRRYALGV